MLGVEPVNRFESRLVALSIGGWIRLWSSGGYGPPEGACVITKGTLATSVSASRSGPGRVGRFFAKEHSLEGELSSKADSAMLPRRTDAGLGSFLSSNAWDLSRP